MKRLREMRKQLISGLIMLSVSIPLLLVALSVESKTPTLAFRGMTMEMQADGSVQLLMTVSIENVDVSQALPMGARFQLKYNTEYLTPSRQDNNVALKNGENASLAFRYNPKLYIEKDSGGNWVSKDPFVVVYNKEWNQNSITGGEGLLSLSLTADRNIVVDPAKNQGLTSVRSGRSSLNVFNTADKIVLGTLSFRVDRENLDKLPEITENFGHIVELEDPIGKNTKYLIQNKDLKVAKWHSGSWAIAVANEATKGSANYTEGYLDNSDEAKSYTDNSTTNPYTYKPYAESRFTFEFPPIIIGVEPAEPELTVDAYQAYTTGHITAPGVDSDLDIVLQKYSPAVLVKYSDGSRKNEIFPWGRTAAPWTTSKVTRWEDDVAWSDTTKTITDDNTDPDYKYDPTGGDYKVQKLYCYTEKVNGVDVQKVFPLPVSVHLTVTPITLVDVVADDLYRVYPLNNALVGPTGVQELSDLDLPEEARLLTDVPAGGATLAMTIPGWSHENDVYTDASDQYWPFSSVAGENPKIRDLQKDDATQKEYHRWPVNDDLAILTGGSDWSTVETGNSQPVGENRAGLYTFEMASGYGQAPVEGFTRTQIKTAYPWLTVPDNNETANVEIWPLDNALRRIVWDGSETDKKLVDRDRYKVTYQSTITDSSARPELMLPDLTLRVEKLAEGAATNVSLPDGTLFRIKLPDGTEVMTTDTTTDDWFTPAAAGDYNGKYVRTKRDIKPEGTPTSIYAFDLTLNPGQTDTGFYAVQRERLLRYINLGGWFSVSVNEDPETYYWSDFIPVYVPPRRNVHLEDKVYNFVAGNADLYHFISASRTTPVFPTTITLPAGRYEVVDAVGDPIYDTVTDAEGGTAQVRRQERYGVKTLYSGVDGSQFGELNTFSIEPNAWYGPHSDGTTTDGAAITRYEANNNNDMGFKHDARYGVYNWVHNPGLRLVQEDHGVGIDPTFHYEDQYYTATIRTQNALITPPDPDDPNALREGITLTYEGPPGGVTNGADGNVDLVTFDTRIEGYTVRQEYTLVITNVGDIDIHGLAIDLETDLYNDSRYGQGGNFTLLKPPASFLPAGERTTFTLSYVYDLRSANDGSELEYLDKLFITSDNKHTVGPGKVEGKDYLLDFDAQFKVTGDKIHRVLVRYNPADGYMGTAQVIVGDLGGVMNTNAGSSAATTGSTVYVMATPTDEYEVQAYSAVGSNGSPVNLSPWTGTITLADGVTTLNIDENSQIRIWSLTMPDSDVTVTIDFYEPISSKLRLSDLKAYASANETDLYENNQVKPIDQRKPFEYAVWQKSFTKEEYQAAADNRPDANVPGAADPNRAPNEEEKDRYLMQHGKAEKKGYSDKVNQYLVVIPYEANYAQVEATLREVLYPADGSGNLPRGTSDTITVEMTLYPEKQDPFICSTQQIYSDTNGRTSPPTTHTSRSFDSPTPGESNYVRVSISYNNPAATGENETRYYFVEIHRAPKDPIAELEYGNSPYGMIMNATNIATADKTAAKTAFVNNKYSFDGLDPSLVPQAVKDAADAGNGRAVIPFNKLHYWTEAWVAPDAAYEPESHMGYLYNSTTYEWSPDPNIYKVENNLDLSDTAFFAILGEPFKDPGLHGVLDSTGRPGRVKDATLSLQVYTLDTTPGLAQTERFALPADPNSTTLTQAEKDALAARTVTLSRQTPAGSTIDDWSDLINTFGEYLRPGRYQLVYTLPDFDYDDYMATDPAKRDPNRDPTLKVTRDFVVLAPVGDVNANVQDGAGNVSDNTDELLVKGRVTEPLGYMAPHYSYDGAIFKLRSCDVNNDRNINNIDANTIRVNKCVERYYLPVGYKK